MSRSSPITTALVFALAAQPALASWIDVMRGDRIAALSIVLGPCRYEFLHNHIALLESDHPRRAFDLETARNFAWEDCREPRSGAQQQDPRAGMGLHTEPPIVQTTAQSTNWTQQQAPHTGMALTPEQSPQISNAKSHPETTYSIELIKLINIERSHGGVPPLRLLPMRAQRLSQAYFERFDQKAFNMSNCEHQPSLLHELQQQAETESLMPTSEVMACQPKGLAADPYDIVRRWMESPVHREILLERPALKFISCGLISAQGQQAAICTLWKPIGPGPIQIDDAPDSPIEKELKELTRQLHEVPVDRLSKERDRAQMEYDNAIERAKLSFSPEGRQKYKEAVDAHHKAEEEEEKTQSALIEATEKAEKDKSENAQKELRLAEHYHANAEDAVKTTYQRQYKVLLDNTHPQSRKEVIEAAEKLKHAILRLDKASEKVRDIMDKIDKARDALKKSKL